MNKELILKALKEKDMTQKKLAAECGVSENYINYIINGMRMPSVPLLRRISDVLEITADELIREE